VWSELVLRTLIGGTVISAFALLGDLLKPKSFAGLFGAAPSVALATLILTAHAEGTAYAALEARSMMAGAIAFGAYSIIVCQVLARMRMPGSVVLVSILSLVGWSGVAFALWTVFLR
jgi:hypothetical protein